MSLFSLIPNDIFIKNIPEFLDIFELKEFKYISKKFYKIINFNKEIIKNKIKKLNYNFISPPIAYNISKLFLIERDIDSYLRMIPYFNIPISLSIFCSMNLDNTKKIIDGLRRYPNLIEYEQLISDNIINRRLNINTYSYFITNYLYYLIAKWTFGVNIEVFLYCVKKGCEKGYSHLFSKHYFNPINEEEVEYYNDMLRIINGNLF